MPALCRDCLTTFDAGSRCPACRSPRVVSHPELFALTIAHMDCDAFYASVEKRDDPALRSVPVIVGGARRGVVSTCCYLARIKGVRSAMPMFQALRLCPEAVVIKPRGSHYAAVLAALLQLAGEHVHSVEIAPEPDIDEAWQEPQAFDGCSTRGQARPDTPQTVHFVRDRASTQIGAAK